MGSAAAKSWTVIVHLHRASEISEKGSQHRRPELHTHLVLSFTCTALLFQMFCFSVLYAARLQLKVDEQVTSLTRRFSLCRCQDSFSPYEKKASEKYDHPCKTHQLLPIDNLQNPLLLADSAK